MVNKDITFNTDALLLGIGIMELPMNCVVVISEGIAKVRELPEHGEYRIVTHQGKIKRMRREEGEEF
ncbi:MULTISPECIES: XtrA/YqaO family protein [Sporosarcina]|uniref:XtrA/YqaO family protein n=1 Tax=Sporosarcina TaxID=1569 RepID=UPI00351C3A21